MRPHRPFQRHRCTRTRSTSSRGPRTGGRGFRGGPGTGACNDARGPNTRRVDGGADSGNGRSARCAPGAQVATPSSASAGLHGAWAVQLGSFASRPMRTNSPASWRSWLFGLCLHVRCGIRRAFSRAHRTGRRSGGRGTPARETQVSRPRRQHRGSRQLNPNKCRGIHGGRRAPTVEWRPIFRVAG